jgi:hypothetical protein
VSAPRFAESFADAAPLASAAAQIEASFRFLEAIALLLGEA